MSVCRRQRLVIAMASKLQSDADSPSEVDAELSRLCVPASCRQPGAIGRLRGRATTECIVRVRRHKQRLLVPTSLELRAGTDAFFGKWARGLSHHRGGSGGPTCLMGADIAPCCIAFPCAVQRCARSARQRRRQTTRRTRAASAAVRRAARRTAYYTTQSRLRTRGAPMLRLTLHAARISGAGARRVHALRPGGVPTIFRGSGLATATRCRGRRRVARSGSARCAVHDGHADPATFL
jgi:hypothetical protein